MRAPYQHRPLIFVVCIAAVLVGLSGTKAGSLELEVRQMVQATRELHYQGILVHAMPLDIAAMKLYHQGGTDGGYRERVVMLTGPARELVRKSGQVWRYHPDSKKVIQSPHLGGSGLLKLGEGHLKAVGHYYRLAYGPSGRVAGRSVKAVELRAIRDDRFSYRIWRDQETALPLQMEVLSPQGRVVENLLFATIDLDCVLTNAELELSAPKDARWIQRHSFLNGKRGGLGLLEGLELPPGFYLANYLEGPGGGEEKHALYTDGLARLSIFWQPKDAAEAPRTGQSGKVEVKIFRRGAVHVSTLYQNGYKITILGELPAGSIREIATSLLASQAADM